MSDTLPPAQSMPPTDLNAAKFVVRSVRADDLPAIEALHDVAFGPGALTRAAYRVRERQPPFSAFCRVLYDGATLVASIRFTPVLIGGRGNALLLGPLAVAPAYANKGHGRRLIAEGIAAASAGGIGMIVLVGDPPYYQRFGFKPAVGDRIELPGPFDPARLLVLPLTSGVLNPLSPAYETAQPDQRASYGGRLTGAA